MASGGGGGADRAKTALTKYWVEPWKELASDVSGSKLLASGADMAREMFVEPWKEMGADFVEVAKPLAQRGAAAAAAAIRSPSAAVAAAVPDAPQAEPPAEPRSHAPAPAPLIVDLPASYFPAPPGAEAEPPARRAQGVSRPLVPASEPAPQRPPPQFFQGSARAPAPGQPIMMTPLEIQRMANARAAAARQHYAQHAQRPPLPNGALLVGAASAPAPAEVAEARRVREAATAAAARSQAQAEGSGGGGEAPAALAKRLDDMFSVIGTLPRGVSAEAEDWAAVAVAERAAQLRGATGGGSSGSLSASGGVSTGAAAAIAAAASAREALARDAAGLGHRGGGAAAEAERARQRLAALRSAHPDSFPLNPRALYTPWRDAGQGSRDPAHALEIEEEEEENETHVVARLLGSRWRVRVAAALAVLTAGVYLRGERAGWGVEGTAGGLLRWRAGDKAAVELDNEAGGGNRTHAQLSLVVRATESDADAAKTLLDAQRGDGLEEQAAAAVAAAGADAGVTEPPELPAEAGAAAEAEAKALAEATQTHARRRALRSRQTRVT